jgi:hypothetical protein
MQPIRAVMWPPKVHYLWLYSPCRPWPLFQFLSLYTVSRPSWTGSTHRKAATFTQNTTNTECTHRHSCVEWDSNPRSQCSSGKDDSCLRLRDHCDRPTENLLYLICLNVSICCQISPLSSSILEMGLIYRTYLITFLRRESLKYYRIHALSHESLIFFSRCLIIPSKLQAKNNVVQEYKCTEE